MSSVLSVGIQRIGRLLLPCLFWNGAGKVVRKVHVKPSDSAGYVVVGRVQQGFVTGRTLERWVLVVAEGEFCHYVAVDSAVWAEVEQGQQITADSPLFADFGRDMFKNPPTRARLF